MSHNHKSAVIIDKSAVIKSAIVTIVTSSIYIYIFVKLNLQISFKLHIIKVSKTY